MKKYLFIILLIGLFAGESYAGGDAWQGRVTSFEKHNGSYTFTMKFPTKEIRLPSNCRQITVNYKYKRVPWYSWLPFIETSHPSYSQSKKAIQYIENKYNQNQDIYFGYMGSGLIPVENECTFKTKGLGINESENIKAILAYHNPV